MSLSRTRSNLITVRLSEDEHQKLKDACEHGAARSISDYVRDTIVQRLSYNLPSARHLTGELDTLAGKLHDLDTTLQGKV